MSRLSINETVNGIVKNGFDYDLQVWVKDFIILDCGHPEGLILLSGFPCRCLARKYQGQDIREVNHDRS